MPSRADELIDVWYSGKAHAHGGNVQAVLPGRVPAVGSAAEPSSVHDLTVGRLHVLYHAAKAELPTLADPGYDGAGIGIYIPAKQPADG